MNRINALLLRIKNSRAYLWVNSNEQYQNYRWYVFIALIASWIQILTYCSVQETNKEVKSIVQGAYNTQDTPLSETLSWDVLIKTYFEALANQDYSTACGLESRRKCLKDVPSEFIQYAEDKKRVWFTKWEDGEHIEKIWLPQKQSDNPNIETWCVKSKYTIKGETTPIEQTSRYDILRRPTGEKEIAWVLCEKSFKNWEDRTKPMGCGQSNICN